MIGQVSVTNKQCKKIITAIFAVAIMSGVVQWIGAGSAHATESYLTVSMESAINLDIASASASGTFKKSANNTIKVTTNHYTGYTMSIKTTDASASTTPPALKSTKAGSTDRVSSIESALTEDQFKALAATGYNNMYGYLPSKYCTTSNDTTNCAANTSFLPAPKLTGDILDITDTNNNEQAREYTVAIGARVDNLKPMGTYTNTFEVLLVSNAIPYTLIYDDNVVGNMPTDQNDTLPNTSLPLSSNVPTRDGYTFTGWCTVAPTASQYNDTCSGTTYAASSTYTLDETTTNNIHLYAMWKRNTIQNVSEWASNLSVGDETTAIDTRDGKTYSVARLCMEKSGDACTSSNLWMTQNLDLIVGGAGVGNLTSTDSDINNDLGATMGYSTAGGVITWTPNSTLNVPAVITNHASGNPSSSVTGWNNSDTVPYQGEGGDYYIFTSGNDNADTIYASLTACVAGGHTIEECNHYHVGNYYNWSAAVAGSDTTAYTTDLAVMPNSICPKGWRLPNGLTGTSGNETISEFNQLALANGITNGQTKAHSTEDDRWVNVGWNTDGFNNWRTAPFYFTRSGYLNDSTLYNYSTSGYLWSSTVRSESWGYYLVFDSGGLYPAGQGGRVYGFPVRCVAR